MNHFCKGVPVLLVGCKTDLRQDQEVLQKLKDGRMEPVSRQQVGATSSDTARDRTGVVPSTG